MENKEFVPYQEALLLKELGFDKPCFKVYDTLGFIQDEKEMDNLFLEKCPAPLYQQAFRWFRDNHNLHGQVNIRTWFIYETSNGNLTMVDLYDKLNNSHEESELVCLKELIQIVKNK